MRGLELVTALEVLGVVVAVEQLADKLVGAVGQNKPQDEVERSKQQDDYKRVQDEAEPNKQQDEEQLGQVLAVLERVWVWVE